MSPRTWSSQTPEDTASFPNVPDVDDDELAEFLAVVVDRTGQPVEVRSNSDRFSCDIRNVKSAQSQFPLVTQPKRMISQTGGGLLKKGSLRSVKALTHRGQPNSVIAFDTNFLNCLLELSN